MRVTQPLVRDVTDYQEFKGHIVAAREVELTARASGTVFAVNCRPGQVVKLGDCLFQIDPRLYKAALDQAEAELERVRARRTLAQNELANTKRLHDQMLGGQSVVSENEVKQVEIKLLEAGAAVKVAEAARDVSRLNLEFTEVTAPFDGRVSGPVLNQGNLAVADSTRLATIVSTDRVGVTFNVHENISLRFRRLRSELWENKGEVVVSLADWTEYPHRGKIDSIEVGIDTATHSARWRASIPNPDGLLVPGMSVRVKLAMGAPHKAIVIPQRATFEILDKRYVYVVGDDDVVHQREIVIQSELEELFVIKKGSLDMNDKIVFEGIREIHDGEKIKYEFRRPEQVLANPKNKAE